MGSEPNFVQFDRHAGEDAFLNWDLTPWLQKRMGSEPNFVQFDRRAGEGAFLNWDLTPWLQDVGSPPCGTDRSYTQ